MSDERVGPAVEGVILGCNPKQLDEPGLLNSVASRIAETNRVWLLFGNELPPLHRLKEALLVLINMEGPVLLEMLREVNCPQP